MSFERNLPRLYLAFRQAKAALWQDRRGIGATALARFELQLLERLRTVDATMRANDGWFDHVPLGRAYVTPKKQLAAASSSTNILRISDHAHNFDHALEVRVQLCPSPAFALVETLYLLHFGAALDAVLRPESIGYRLDIRGGEAQLSRQRRWLFQFWPDAYGRFRNEPLLAAQAALRDSDNVGGCLLISADLAGFYDNVDPRFLLDHRFLERLSETTGARGISFSVSQYRTATASLLRAYARFRARAARITGLPLTTGVPIGALTSRVVANVALGSLDEHISAQKDLILYRRYVDDLILVARPSEGRESETVSSVLRRFLPLRDPSDGDTQLGDAVLDESYLERPGCQFVLKESKLKVHHLEGRAGFDFLGAVRSDLARLTSERRAFADADILSGSEDMPLVRATDTSGSRLRVLRDADRIRLEQFSFSIRLKTLRRAAKLLDPSEARELISQAVQPLVRVLAEQSDWVENVEAVFSVLGLCTLVGAIDAVSQIIVNTDSLWASFAGEGASRVALSWNGRAIHKQAARASLRDYLEERRFQAVAEALPLVEPNLQTFGAVVVSTRGHQRRIVDLKPDALLLASADLRLLDREDESARGHDIRPFDVARLDRDLRRSRHFSRRFALVDLFNAQCRRLGDRAWAAPSASLFLHTRPPSYFDIARRMLYRADSTRIKHSLFARVRDIVNAIRGTAYREPVCDAIDNATVAGPDHAGDASDSPRIILGNLVTEDPWFEAAARGNPVLSRRRLSGLARVLERAEYASRHPRLDRSNQFRTLPRSLLVLPELSLPRAWVREVGHLIGRDFSFGLVAGLEYLHGGRGTVFNQVVAAFPGGFASSFVWCWTKRRPAREEAAVLAQLDVAFARVPRRLGRRTVIRSIYGDLSVLVCSELIEARMVAELLGRAEVVLVPSWNTDTASYDHLVQSVGLQLHAFIAVANNGHYSDCRIWAPHETRWQRDLCRLIQRDVNGVVFVDLPLLSLRRFHRTGGAMAPQGAAVRPARARDWKALPPDWP